MDNYIRILVYNPGNKQKPVFERIITRSDDGQPFSADVVVNALRMLFGKFAKIQTEYYAE